jgi:hypothetical protein
MISSSRTLFPALVLTALVAASGAASPPAHPEPEVTGTAAERAAGEKAELRPSQESVAPEKRPVRVILPSPYSGKR